MNRDGWHEGPKRGTRRGRREYKRVRKLQMMAARANRMEDNVRGKGLGQRLMIVNDEIFAGMGTLGEDNRRRRILELKEEIKTLKYNTTNSKQRWN